MEWYDWRNVCESLVTFGRAIQGVSPYTVVIEPDTRKCETGFCNFTKRRIAVNPKLFPDRTPKEQYSLTKALLVHEAGHRRFTTLGTVKGLLHLVINILEDERQHALDVAGQLVYNESTSTMGFLWSFYAYVKGIVWTP